MVVRQYDACTMAAHRNIDDLSDTDVDGGKCAGRDLPAVDDRTAAVLHRKRKERSAERVKGNRERDGAGRDHSQGICAVRRAGQTDPPHP